MYVCMYACMYVCMYVCTYRHSGIMFTWSIIIIEPTFRTYYYRTRVFRLTTARLNHEFALISRRKRYMTLHMSQSWTDFFNSCIQELAGFKFSISDCSSWISRPDTIYKNFGPHTFYRHICSHLIYIGVEIFSLCTIFAQVAHQPRKCENKEHEI